MQLQLKFAPGSTRCLYNMTMQATSTLKKSWYTPVLGSLMQGRLEGAVLVGAGLLQVGLHAFGLTGWACPFKSLFGIPCPGCGLTLAMDELLHGHLYASLHAHAFAPLFLLVFILLAISQVLPETWRKSLATFISTIESRSGCTAWVLTFLMLYWCMRLLTKS